VPRLEKAKGSASALCRGAFDKALAFSVQVAVPMRLPDAGRLANFAFSDRKFHNRGSAFRRSSSLDLKQPIDVARCYRQLTLRIAYHPPTTQWTIRYGFWHGGLCLRCMALLQLGILGLGLFIDGNVGVGAFPQSKEVLVGGFRFGVIALHCIRSTQLPVR
jgi:hypothetical protein